MPAWKYFGIQEIGLVNPLALFERIYRQTAIDLNRPETHSSKHGGDSFKLTIQKKVSVDDNVIFPTSVGNVCRVSVLAV